MEGIMKKILLCAVMVVFCSTLFCGISETTDNIIHTIDTNIVKVKENLKSVEGKKGEDASGILKVCDQLLANNYSLLTKLEYRLSKEKSRMSNPEIKEMKNLIGDYYHTMKGLKRSVETGDIQTDVVNEVKKEDVTIKSEIEAEKLVQKTVSDAAISHEMEKEITIASDMDPGTVITNYGKNIDIKIRNAGRVMVSAKKILTETGEHPRVAVRKEKGQVNDLVRSAEATLKQMNYVLDKNAFRLKSMNLYDEKKDLIKDYVFKVKEFNNSVNEFFNPPRTKREGSGGTSITTKIKNMFSGKSGAANDNIPEFTYKSRHVEDLPADEEYTNDQVYIDNNFSRIEKRFIFIENSLNKLNSIDRASKEAVEYQDEIGYLFRQTGRALKNIELKLEKNAVIFKHGRSYKTYENTLRDQYSKLSELMQKVSDYKKNI